MSSLFGKCFSNQIYSLSFLRVFELRLTRKQGQQWGNPRFWWTYSDEDMQRVMKEVALSCHATHVPHMALYKWILSLFE